MGAEQSSEPDIAPAEQSQTLNEVKTVSFEPDTKAGNATGEKASSSRRRRVKRGETPNRGKDSATVPTRAGSRKSRQRRRPLSENTEKPQRSHSPTVSEERVRDRRRPTLRGGGGDPKKSNTVKASASTKSVNFGVVEEKSMSGSDVSYSDSRSHSDSAVSYSDENAVNKSDSEPSGSSSGSEDASGKYIAVVSLTTSSLRSTA